MSEKLENALVEIIEKANSGLDAATEFVMAELPEVVQQALTWYFVESLIFSIVGLLLLMFSYKALKIQYDLLYKKDGKLRDWADDGYGMSGPAFVYSALTVILDAFLIIFAITNALSFTWLKILIAPKLWLIEYASKLAG